MNDYIRSLDKQKLTELYMSYLGNVRRFEIQGIPPKCTSCFVHLPKIQYVKGFGMCADCWKAQNEKRKEDEIQSYRDMLYLKKNGLI